LSFFIWSGLPAPLDAMRAAARRESFEDDRG
jgi:hypothetical protein